MMILPQLITQQHDILEMTLRVPAEQAFEVKRAMYVEGMVVVGAEQSVEFPDLVVMKFGRRQDWNQWPFGSLGGGRYGG